MNNRTAQAMQAKKRNQVASFICALIVHHSAESIDSSAIAHMLSMKTDTLVRQVLNALVYFGALQRDSEHNTRYTVVNADNDIVSVYAQDKRAQAQAQHAVKALERSAQAKARQAHRKASA